MAAAALRSFHISRPLQLSLPDLPRIVEEVKSLRFISAVKTPYLSDGRIDIDAYDGLVKLQIENGAEGILVGGSTGEGQLMTWNDHVMLVAHTVHRYGTKTKVIGNMGSNCTSEALTATEQGFAVGMHAALHINPFYCRTSSDGLLSHFNSLLPLGPLIVYNIPARSAQDVPPEVIHALAKHPNFVGIKECTGKMDRIEEYTKAGISVWTGMDVECHAVRWKHGATGVQSVASNLIPGLTRELMYGGWNPELQEKLEPLYKWLVSEPNPIPVSTALVQLGLVKPVFKLPYVPLPLEKRKEFVNLVKQIGRECFVGDKDVQVLDDTDFIVLDRY